MKQTQREVALMESDELAKLFLAGEARLETVDGQARLVVTNNEESSFDLSKWEGGKIQ